MQTHAKILSRIRLQLALINYAYVTIQYKSLFFTAMVLLQKYSSTTSH